MHLYMDNSKRGGGGTQDGWLGLLSVDRSNQERLGRVGQGGLLQAMRNDRHRHEAVIQVVERVGLIILAAKVP